MQASLNMSEVYKSNKLSKNYLVSSSITSKAFAQKINTNAGISVIGSF
jgi:hypothetical protein